MKKTQNEMVLEYLKRFGHISQAEAMANFGCQRLAARINDLKRFGFKIEADSAVGINRFGDPVRFSVYRLMK